MHAMAVEHLLAYVIPNASNPSPRILDVGSGSGYLTHLMAELTGEQGIVVGVEHIETLRRLGETNMGKSVSGRALLESARVRFRIGDGRKGWKEENDVDEWDAIHVGASAKEMHEELVAGLKSPGCMFIPVDDDETGSGQHIWSVEKDEQGAVTQTKLFGVRYVPLTDAPATLET
jgi:protein-L-isoaspartate(D-aspartate) O-methyltransferase